MYEFLPSVTTANSTRKSCIRIASSAGVCCWSRAWCTCRIAAINHQFKVREAPRLVCASAIQVCTELYFKSCCRMGKNFRVCPFCFVEAWVSAQITCKSGIRVIFKSFSFYYGRVYGDIKVLGIPRVNFQQKQSDSALIMWRQISNSSFYIVVSWKFVVSSHQIIVSTSGQTWSKGNSRRDDPVICFSFREAISNELFNDSISIF